MTTNQPTPIDQDSGENPAPYLAPAAKTDGPQVDLAPVWELIKRLPTYVRLSTGLARDPRVPAAAKATLALGGIYVVSPVDLIPGLIPLAGQLDDLYVVLTGLQQSMRITPDHVVEEHLANHGLTRHAVDDDLAVLRTFVRQGAIWMFQKGGTAMVAAGRQTRDAVSWVRKLGNKQS